MTRALFFASLLAPLLGWAQASPEDEWQAPPNVPQPALPPPSPPAVTPAPLPPTTVSTVPVPAPTIGEVRARLRPREEPNSVSMFGAPALGQWKRGQAFILGFPFFQLRASIGLLDNLDVGVGYDSFYLLMHDLRLSVKYGFGKGPGFAVALALEGGPAFFNQRASREQRGPRWITGRRNWNVAPGVILSYQGESLRAARLFIDLRYMLTIDTEPFATTPLQGVPPTFTAGHNVLAKVGAELPLSERTSFLFSLGLDVHLRDSDSPVMPSVAVGLVTGL